MLFRILAWTALAAMTASAGGPPAPPAGWKDGYVMANGIRIHYWRTGGAKPVMVLLHGSSDDGLCWTNFAKEFSGQFDIVMWDARGHGLSDPPNELSTQQAMVEDLAAFLRALNIQKPVLMGHSMGSATVAWFSSRYPDVPKAVILEDPNLAAAGYPSMSDEEREKRRAGILAGNNRSWDETFAGCMKNSPKWGESECATWVNSKLRHHPNTARSTPGERPAMKAMLTKITAPALILKADAQGELRAQNEEAAKALVKGKIVHIAGAGHNKQQTVDEMRAFLATVQ
jgi:pimeloyl-ACP methyl ester carboxylesterase